MGKNTKIAWADHTFNPWWGCYKVSPECANCYAERDSKRWGMDYWGPLAPRKSMSDKYWNEPLKWDKASAEAIAAGSKPARVFSASMSDVFEDRSDLNDYRDRLWSLIEATPNLIWMLLTKRPESWGLMPARWWNSPPKNVWLGITAGTQQCYTERKGMWKKLWPDAVKFLSMEPLLEPVSVGLWPDWVIVGCESGPKARPMEPDWVRSIRDECLSAGIPFFYKQGMVDGELTSLPELDGKVWAELPEGF